MISVKESAKSRPAKIKKSTFEEVDLEKGGLSDVVTKIDESLKNLAIRPESKIGPRMRVSCNSQNE